MTVKDIAELLKAKPKTVYQWAELGQIPCLKLNGSLRFDLEDIEAWIRESKKESQKSYNLLTQVRGPKKGGK